jgi:hypothetical protein
MRTHHLPIANPCHEDWDAMDPVAQGRFCHSCSKQVHDLSDMTENEAQDVLHANAGTSICVRYCHDDRGNVRFRPAMAARVAVAGLALAACTPHDAGPRHNPAPIVQQPLQPMPTERVTMGEMPPEPPRPVFTKMGDVAPPAPEPVTFVKGAVEPSEPCDPPKPPADVVEPVRVVKGELKATDPVAELPKWNESMR